METYETVTPSVSPTQSCYRALFCDIALSWPAFDFSSDLQYILQRLEREGEHFRLITLPSLGKAIETSVVTGTKLMVPVGWKMQKRSQLPIFLRHLTKMLFGEDGFPLNNGSSKAYRDVRQVTMMYSKENHPCEPEIENEAIAKFLDRVTLKTEIDLSNSLVRELIPLMRDIACRVLNGDSHIHLELRRFQKNPWGRHGSGAVAGREVGSEKWSFVKYPNTPEKLFQWCNEKCVKQHTHEVPTGRVCAVPKDYRGPRIICIEPKEHQFAQQGIMDILYRLFSVHPLTRRAISFDEVGPSQERCFDANTSTIDLKDASDNLRLSLARLVLPKWFFALVTRYRTRQISYNGKLFFPTCLASMGNACCFPLETFLFWLITRAAMYRITESMPRAVRDHLIQDIRVFGDDIIVPAWACDSVVEALEACNLQVNREKTCHLSPIRESCGAYTYNLEDVRIVRCKTSAVTNHRTWLEMRDHSREAREYGYPALAQAMADLCRCQYDVSSFKRRFNRSLQRMEIRVPSFVTKGVHSELSDYSALYAWYVGNDVTPYLKGARKRVKWGWTSYDTFAMEWASVFSN